MPERADGVEITVLITAHNEAERIESCLRAINDQDYPMERVEVVLVDDRSDDDTAARARALGGPNLRVIRMDAAPGLAEPAAGRPAPPPAPGFSPPAITTRQTALHRGISEARGEVVLVTDAGARPPREWIRELSGHLGYRDGAVTGPVIFAGPEQMLARFQTLDALVTFTLFRWANRHRIATGLLGANMALRRSAYFETGGFPAIGFAMSEDFALGMALCRAGWSVRYLTGPAVLKPTSKSLGAMLARGRRRLHHISPAITAISSFFILSNVLFAGLACWLHGWWVLALLGRYGAGVLVLLMWSSQYGANQLLPAVLIYEPLMTVLGGLLHLLNFVRPRWRWGGVLYRPPAKPVRAARTPADPLPSPPPKAAGAAAVATAAIDPAASGVEESRR